MPGPRRHVEHQVVRSEREPVEHPPGVGGEHLVAFRVLERVGLGGEGLDRGFGSRIAAFHIWNITSALSVPLSLPLLGADWDLPVCWPYASRCATTCVPADRVSVLPGRRCVHRPVGPLGAEAISRGRALAAAANSPGRALGARARPRPPGEHVAREPCRGARNAGQLHLGGGGRGGAGRRDHPVLVRTQARHDQDERHRRRAVRRWRRRRHLRPRRPIAHRQLGIHGQPLRT